MYVVQPASTSIVLPGRKCAGTKANKNTFHGSQRRSSFFSTNIISREICSQAAEGPSPSKTTRPPIENALPTVPKVATSATDFIRTVRIEVVGHLASRIRYAVG
mmetsp:Transcript_26686/g.40139  ORF Transcript_26686/g.40139 Transcript_26686/m.40139 type:complete len:104 (-) Transcript_26686:139-450(-)